MKVRPRIGLLLIATIASAAVVAVSIFPHGGPASANPLADMHAVAAGGNHTCALNAFGGVVCWGDNHYGELGDGTSVNRSRAVPVTELTGGVASLALGYNHTCALLDSGGVKCWGYNRYGQLGNPTGVGNQFSTNPNPLDVTGLQSGVVAITAGAAHSCALMDTGGVKCWGWDFAGQLGDGPGCGAICPTPRDVSGLTSGVVSVDAGLYHTCAVLNNGAVRCWGQNDFGQLGAATGSPCFYVTLEPLACSFAPVDVTGLTDAVSVSAGGVYDGVSNASHTCAMVAGGGVKCWGANASGQLGDDRGCGAVCQSPVDVVDLNGDPVSGALEVSTGAQHSCYRGGPNSRLYCWGEGSDGQIGHNGSVDKSRATEICANQLCDELDSVDSVSLGLDHACALLAGELICWGSNVSGQLGDGGGCGQTCSAPIHPGASKGDLPDLIVSKVRIELETGGSCAFTSTNLGTRVEFRNIGTGDAGPFVVDVNGVQQTYSDGLPAGALGNLWFSSYHYGEPTAILLDATFALTESDETNNTFEASVAIPTLPLPCTPTRTVTPVPPTATPTLQTTAGDANCDHTVNSIDAALVLQYVAGLLQSLQCSSGADVNDDGTINSIDAALVLQYVAGLIDEL